MLLFRTSQIGVNQTTKMAAEWTSADLDWFTSITPSEGHTNVPFESPLYSIKTAQCSGLNTAAQQLSSSLLTNSNVSSAENLHHF